MKMFPNLAITVGRTEIILMVMVVALEVMKIVTDVTQTLATCMITIVTVNDGRVVEGDATKASMHFKTMPKEVIIKLH
jgi:hypothetical protein